MTGSRTAARRAPRRIPPAAWVVFGAVVVAVYVFLGEHRLHAASLLPYLVLLACPLMHLLHRHGHGGGHGSAAHGLPGAASSSDDRPSAR